MRLALSVWRRDFFAVCLWPALDAPASAPLRTALVRGVISGPFGVYAGTPHEVRKGRGGAQYTLVHLPSQFPQVTLASERLCREAARELGACDLSWEAGSIFEVVGTAREIEKVLAVRSRWSAMATAESGARVA